MLAGSSAGVSLSSGSRVAHDFANAVLFAMRSVGSSSGSARTLTASTTAASATDSRSEQFTRVPGIAMNTAEVLTTVDWWRDGSVTPAHQHPRCPSILRLPDWGEVAAASLTGSRKADCRCWSNTLLPETRHSRMAGSGRQFALVRFDRTTGCWQEDASGCSIRPHCRPRPNAATFRNSLKRKSRFQACSTYASCVHAADPAML
jgi:hypothetical protein